MNQPPQVADVWFRDVTDDAETCRAADSLPDWRTRFAALGFHHIGYLGEYRIPGGALWVHEVLSSANGDAYLTLALLPDHPLRSDPRTTPTATLESALEDGSILITTTYPEYLWRLDHPKAGVYLEGWSEATPEELWQHHRQHVEQRALERDSSVLPHVSMALRLWIAERCNEVGDHVAVMALMAGVAAFLWIFLSLVRLMDWLDAWVRVRFGALRPLFYFLGLAAIAAAGVGLVRSRVMRAWLAGQWFA